MSSKAKPGTSRHAAGSKIALTPLPAALPVSLVTAPFWPHAASQRTARHSLLRCARAGRRRQRPMTLQIFGITGLPEITPGAELAPMILDNALAAGVPIVDGDVVVVTSKIVSKAENRLVELADVVASPFAVEWSAAWDK